MALFQIQCQWILKHDAMRGRFDPDGSVLAGPFLSVPDPAATTCRQSPILLVGQATRGDWWLKEFDAAKGLSLKERVEERRRRTAEFLTKARYDQYKNTDFWHFFRNLKDKTGAPVIWSNLAKIGVQKGNPRWQLVREQGELAVASLKAEITAYEPALVILLTGTLGRHEAVAQLLGVDKNTKPGAEGVFAARDCAQGGPTIIWTWHPGRKAWELTNGWLDRACQLYTMSSKS
jgi:hypothetical protein